MISRISLLLIVIALNSCSLNEHSSTKGCPISQYDNTKLVKGELAYQAPETWQETQISNPMRKAEYLLDAPSQTKVAVYFFEGMRDQLEPNLRRWKNQFLDGKDRQLIEKKQFNRFKLPITIYYLTGTYLDKEKIGDPSSPTTVKPDHALLAAIVEMKQGTWFFKAVGPGSVIASARTQFDDLVFSFQPVVNKG